MVALPEVDEDEEDAPDVLADVEPEEGEPAAELFEEPDVEDPAGCEEVAAPRESLR
ncbi:hypothetical protein [Serinibacter salmoneus]|uniref:hypothetical protein n=1 Tax=Serinibacter salmoneus TaxID=556530 RepID=UPI00318406AA